MSCKALRGVRSILSTHHSKDPAFLCKIGKEMAALEDTYPWKCGYCARLNKKTHTTCPKCQSHGLREHATTQNREARKQHTERTPGMSGMPEIRVRRHGRTTLGAGKHRHRPQDSVHRAHVPGKERRKERRAKERRPKGKAEPIWPLHRPLHLLRLLYHLGPQRRHQVHPCLQPPMHQQQLCRQATPRRM